MFSLTAAGVLAGSLLLFARPRVERLALIRDSRQQGGFAFASRSPGAGGVCRLGDALWVGPVAGMKSRKLFEYPLPPRTPALYDVDGDHVLTWTAFTPGSRRCWVISVSTGAAKEIVAPPGDHYTLFDGSIFAVGFRLPAKWKPGDGRICVLQRCDLSGTRAEVAWEGSATLGEPCRVAGGMAVPVFRDNEQSLLLWQDGRGEPVEYPFPSSRPVLARGRFWWLARAGEKLTLCAGDPVTRRITESELDDGEASLLSDGDRLYLCFIPPDRKKGSTILEVLPTATRTIATGLPRFFTGWIADGALVMVVQEDKEDWWDWSPRGLTGWKEWTLQRFRLPG